MLYSRTVSTVALVLLATGCSGRQVDLSSPDVLVKCRDDVDCPAGKSCGEGAVCQLVEGADEGAGGQEAPSGEGEGEGPSGAGKGEGEGEPTGGSPAGEGEAAAPGEGEGEAPGEPPGEGEGEGEAPGSGEGEGEGEVDPPRPIVAGCGALAFADVGDGVLTEALAPTALDDAVTWETWFKLDAGVDRPDDSPLVLLRNGCDGAQLSLQGAEGGHVVAWRRGLAACEGRTPVAPGRWHHVAAVHGEGPGALLTLFLNGMPECFGEGGDGDPEAPDGPPGADLGRSLIVGAGGPGCPDLGQSVLQLEFDDRQLADSSPSRHPVAPIGDADAVPEFGGVLDLPAAEDHLEVSRGDDFAFGEESFTVEWWMKHGGGEALDVLTAGDGAAGWAVRGLGEDGAWRIVMHGADDALYDTGPTLAFDGEWHHVALTRSGVVVRLFVDGVLVQMGGGDHGRSRIRTGGITPFDGPLRFGGPGRPADLAPGFQGHLDSLRIRRGSAVYADDDVFDPGPPPPDNAPVALERASLATPFPGLISQIRVSRVARYEGVFWPAPVLDSDDNTMLLYRFEAPAAQGAVEDRSAAGIPGTIAGADWVDDGPGCEGGPEIGPAPVVTIFDHTGERQQYEVPERVSRLVVYAWGGGGGGAGGDRMPCDRQADLECEPRLPAGGAGGLTAAFLAVAPGQAFTVSVGGGGGPGREVARLNQGGFGGGAAGGIRGTNREGGGGGGYSGLFDGEVEQDGALLIAGGGGGGGFFFDTNAHHNGYGGAGGGVNGEHAGTALNWPENPSCQGGQGGGPDGPGQGGQVTGGEPGVAGGPLAGGAAGPQDPGDHTAGGGGGGGWFGGGGASGLQPGCGGGGGSGFYRDDAVLIATTLTGRRTSPRGSVLPSHEDGVAGGGAAFTGDDTVNTAQAGGHGAIVVVYRPRAD